MQRITLTQSQQRELALVISFGAQLGKDYMARAMSALYRAARKSSQQDAILAVARAYGVISNPEFII